MEDKKRYIIQCTHQLFKEKGYLDTSIQNILEAADVSKGTFYKYFLSKSDLTLVLLKNLDVQLSTQFSYDFFNQVGETDIEHTKQLIYQIKKFEKENALRRIMTESVIDKDPALMDFIQQRRQKSLVWLYQCMEHAFGQQFPHAITDATLFLQALLTNLTKYSFTGVEEISLKKVIDNCFEKLNLCIDYMNQQPLFKREIIFDYQLISNDEEFVNETLQLKKWLHMHYKENKKFELLLNYLDFILLNHEQLQHFAALKQQIISAFQEAFEDSNHNIQQYIQYLRMK